MFESFKSALFAALLFITFLSHFVPYGSAASIYHDYTSSELINTPLTVQKRGLISNYAKPILSKVKNLFNGRGTYYEVGLGSCGKYDTDDELVVAVNSEQMANGGNPNVNPKCDKMVAITGQKGTTTARIVDTCPTCKRGALDMSPKVFEAVCGQLSMGVCNIDWKFI
ncbi:hypothetical protein BDF20DRAFT_648835 [Mycotypha africana]|uniref:uncharacterized protein n=1 Tax=Mycotypha africana TaxID=64632 RepID=UPI002300EB0E|nr:uncharacterized protein BDF20DRAFT_648835 [Mycotypha africana]KAI8973382.1 hypothetical protein BDF20DRAFT_648835 [Mycotypha africana]